MQQVFHSSRMIATATACRIVMGVDPVAGDELHEQRPVETALAAIIDVLGRCLMAQLCKAQAGGELAIVAPDPFPVEQQRQPFGMGELFGFGIGGQFVECLGHAGQVRNHCSG